MEFRDQDKEIRMPSSSLGYNLPPPPRASAFSRPTLSPSSSLISPKGGGGGLGGGGGAGVFGAISRNNGNIFTSNPAPPQPPPPPPLTLSSAAPTLDHSSSSQSPAKSPEPLPAPSNSSPSSLPNTTAVKSSTAIAADTAAADVSFRYRECLRNHAASIGGHVVDGCGEFMPDGALDTPEALKCAACGCHRSFHRKVAEGEAVNAASSYYRAAAASAGGGACSGRLPLLLPPPHPHSHHHNLQTPRQFQLSGFSSSPSGGLAGSGIVAFGGNTSGSGGTTTESSSEERINVAGVMPTVVKPRKRFRTKFTPEQKEKMLAFAERYGWRIQKQDEAAIEQFCAEAGVRRQVLKVWMHNNKHTIKKHHQQQLPEHDQMPAQRQRQP